MNRALTVSRATAAVAGAISLILEYGFHISQETRTFLHGVDITVVGVFIVYVLAMMRNRDQVEMMRRTIPRTIVHTAVSILALYVAGVFFISLALTLTDPGVPYHHVLFETVSALSTVGLSTGITAGLSGGGKVVLCVAMLIGRIGPLMLLLSIFGQSKQAQYQYPAEDVMVT